MDISKAAAKKLESIKRTSNSDNVVELNTKVTNKVIASLITKKYIKTYTQDLEYYGMVTLTKKGIEFTRNIKKLTKWNKEYDCEESLVDKAYDLWYDNDEHELEYFIDILKQVKELTNE